MTSAKVTTYNRVMRCWPLLVLLVCPAAAHAGAANDDPNAVWNQPANWQAQIALSTSGVINGVINRTPQPSASLSGRKSDLYFGANAQTVGTAVRTVVFANLRSGASTASRVLAVVRPGASLRVIGHVITGSRRWDHVIYGGRTYWVRADLVRAVKARVPSMHVHAFSPMEIANGVKR